jgi:hypothetical protein
MEVHEQDGAFAGAYFHLEEERSDRPNLRDSLGKKTFRPGDIHIHTFIHTSRSDELLLENSSINTYTYIHT